MVDLLLPRLRQDQAVIARHPAKVKVLSAGRRWGKTVLCGAIALAPASQGAKVAWVVPTYRNSRPLWRWAEAAVRPLRARGLVDVSRQEHVIQFPTCGGFLGIFSADNDVGLRGDWFNVAVIDEAARVPEETWEEVIWPTLADADGDAVLPSTPKGKDWFWRLFRAGQARMDDEIASWTAPSSANPNPRIQRAAELAKDRVPPRVWRQEWNAEFVEDAEVIWNLDWFDDQRFNVADSRLNETCIRRWLSVDGAFVDKDTASYSAILVGELTKDYRLRLRDAWHDHVRFPALVRQIQTIAMQYGQDFYLHGGRYERRLAAVVIEDKASGLPAIDTLRETCEPWLASLIQPYTPHGSKDQRAEFAAVYGERGCLMLPQPGPAAPWLTGFEEELESFPNGRSRDYGDAYHQLILYTSRYLREGLAARRAAALQLTQGVAV